MAWIIFFLALTGLLNALYFALSCYGLARGRLIPVVGQGSSCRAVMQTPDARVLGLPNFIFGALYYLGLIVLSWTADPASGWMAAARVASYLAVLLGVYLVYALRYRLHVSCPLCLLGHGVNLALAVCLTVTNIG
ncbi:MAG: hypothetical protein A3F84_15555 [Candidatus Handelsmanbacteria bacterium RIFCSPLOWO2_12_FULL_64_10]|uniref:Vitamin K epoxide reductase domain-containing protein n=1 Tax=Handelsmanbacteria sp. (strain RIFCSPLOWO2_12_FULL_64_10) TaxID=1817868 RepID=A0A1F6D687_HANXR|nr:MAG: hypothetical protein A3F84_15555 [Candidatus Handelsmanbacteria bacterium RIFCSPLOWO2_12_FULL_64_10]